MKKAPIFSRLKRYVGGYQPLIPIAMVLSGISAISAMLPYVCIWFIIKEIFEYWGDLSASGKIEDYAWMAVFFAVLNVILYFLSLTCSHLAAFRVEKNMRKQAMRKITEMPLGFFNHNTSGRMRKIIDDNSSITHTFLAHQLPDISAALLMPIAIVIILFLFDWRLGIASLFPLFLSFVFLKQMMGGDRNGSMGKYMNALEKMNAEAVEYVRGVPVVKVFKQTVFSFKNFHDAIMNYNKFALDYAIKCRFPMVKYTLSLHGIGILLIPVCILLIPVGGNYNEFVLNFIFYILFTPVCALFMNKIMHLGEGFVLANEAVSRIDALLDEEPLKSAESPKAPRNHSIDFSKVSFSYSGSRQKAVDKVSFTIPQGKTYALVGPSGGGKTTVASLIPRFWDVDSGSIKIGGVDVRQMDQKDLMDQVAFVFQNTQLFKMSILDNICFGKPDATREQVERAVDLAQCREIIDKLPSGLDTMIGTKGVYLSGGEQQRVALARAILKDAPIVVLDEATAFADPQNEYQIQLAFERLTKGKTVLMIAHRLSSVKNVDSILVIENGKIVEQGVHTALMVKEGLYSKMWNEYQQSIEWKVGKEVCHG